MQYYVFYGKEKCLTPSSGERQANMDGDSAFAGAAVTLFKDQIVQIGMGIVTAVHGFTFFLKCYLTVYAPKGKKSDVFS